MYKNDLKHINLSQLGIENRLVYLKVFFKNCKQSMLFTPPTYVILLHLKYVLYIWIAKNPRKHIKVYS